MDPSARDHFLSGAGPPARERRVPALLFFLISIAYAALGHEVILNKADCPVCFSHDALPNVSDYDPIGHFLPYARVFICGLAIVTSWLTCGARSAAARAPLLFLPFVVLALASSAWSDAPKQVFRDAATLTALWLALPWVIHRLGAAAAVRLSLHLIAAVVVASCLLAIAVPAIGRHTGAELVQAVHAGRWRGLFGHKNGLGAWAAYGSVFLFTHSRLAGGPRLYWRFAAICALACLIFSGSSTGLIMAVSLWHAWAYLQIARRIGVWPASLLFAFATAALVGAALYELDDILEWIGRDATLSGRTVLWELIIGHFAKSPSFVQLFGSGYQSAGGPAFGLALEDRFGQPMTPEDSYFNLILGVGIVGLLGFCIPCIACIRNGLAWLEHVSGEARASLEFFLMTLVVAFIASFTEATALVPTAYDGILSFGSLFALMVTPRAPRRGAEPATSRSPADVHDGAIAGVPATDVGGPRWRRSRRPRP